MICTDAPWQAAHVQWSLDIHIVTPNNTTTMSQHQQHHNSNSASEREDHQMTITRDIPRCHDMTHAGVWHCHREPRQFVPDGIMDLTLTQYLISDTVWYRTGRSRINGSPALPKMKWSSPVTMKITPALMDLWCHVLLVTMMTQSPLIGRGLKGPPLTKERYIFSVSPRSGHDHPRSPPHPGAVNQSPL